MSYSDYPVNKVEFTYSDIKEAFPDVDCMHVPNGEFVIVQIRCPKKVTSGGIILADDSIKVESDNTQVAKVVAVGPAAFRNRATGDLWYGDEWYKVGDFVRVPRYGGDRWTVPFTHKEAAKTLPSGIRVPAKEFNTEITFALFMDKDIRVKVTDPLKIKSFL